MSSPKTAPRSSFYSASSIERRRFEPLGDPGYTPETPPEDVRQATRDERGSNISNHAHDGADSVPVEVGHLSGFIETVSAVPTIIPKNFFESVKFYSNGGTRRLYVYVNDSSGTGAWRYATLA